MAISPISGQYTETEPETPLGAHDEKRRNRERQHDRGSERGSDILMDGISLSSVAAEIARAVSLGVSSLSSLEPVCKGLALAAAGCES